MRRATKVAWATAASTLPKRFCPHGSSGPWRGDARASRTVKNADFFSDRQHVVLYLLLRLAPVVLIGLFVFTAYGRGAVRRVRGGGGRGRAI